MFRILARSARTGIATDRDGIGAGSGGIATDRNAAGCLGSGLEAKCSGIVFHRARIATNGDVSDPGRFRASTNCRCAEGSCLGFKANRGGDVQ